MPDTEISLLADGTHFMFTLMRWIYVKDIYRLFQLKYFDLIIPFIHCLYNKTKYVDEDSVKEIVKRILIITEICSFIHDLYFLLT